MRRVCRVPKDKTEEGLPLEDLLEKSEDAGFLLVCRADGQTRGIRWV
jgi:hypothetical protein